MIFTHLLVKHYPLLVAIVLVLILVMFIILKNNATQHDIHAKSPIFPAKSETKYSSGAKVFIGFTIFTIILLLAKYFDIIK